MGFFSWLNSDNGKSIRIGNKINLISPSGKVYSSLYDGYGHVDGHDVYFFLAMWNRKEIVQNISMEKFFTSNFMKSNKNQIEDFYDLTKPDSYFYENEKEYEETFRIIGIELNFTFPECMKFPLKFSSNKKLNYETLSASKDDPSQGYWDEENEEDY